MSDVLDRLKAALADRYTIERELGSGRERVSLRDSGIKRCVFLLIIGSLLLPLGCGDDPSGPDYATLVISTTSLPNAAGAVPYSETLVATGGDSVYTWSVTIGSLPTGLSLTASTGLISGTPRPTVLGSQTFTVQVASGDGQTDTQQLTITVEPPVLQPSELCSDYPYYAIATFEDANLEAEVRAALSVGDQEPLTCGLIYLVVLRASHAEITSLVGIQNLEGLTRLYLHSNSISDISGLSRLTSLTVLYLYDNSINDIRGLSGLTNLRSLYLGGNSISDISGLSGLTSLTHLGLSSNSISDISALSGLTSLRGLSLQYNSISDISALSGLTSLTHLDIGFNSISDISALSGLTSLTSLHLSSNSITDISALSGLTSLTELWLDNNPNLSDIQPLLDNAGLGAGDTVYLQSTNVICADVVALEAKGVTVLSDCP